MDEKSAETKDYIVSGLTLDGRFRVLAARTTITVEEARRRHNCSKTATAALGRVMTGAALMVATLRDGHSVTLKVLGDGPCGGIISYAARTETGVNVRGYLGDPTADVPPVSEEKLDVGALVGKKGSVYVTKDIGFRNFYTGSAELQSGEIGVDLAYYYTVSEQIPTALSVGVRLGGTRRGRNAARYGQSGTGWVTGAGGVMVQLMPGSDQSEAKETIARLEENLEKIGSVSLLVQDGVTPSQLAEAVFSGIAEVKLMDVVPVRFACMCSRDRAVRTLMTLGREDLEKLATERETAEVRCHFCNEVYEFSREELREIAREIPGSNATEGNEKGI